ncbi:MAG: hypothetical protein CL677_00320 [Bdellovibrionaceae bacterium]|jgi:hypothetical protein|nr:hypothetical protein [Pseudobdellovibrionaceae bacterium]|tara:strand:+ start:655 stop:888 length:234 start_codon:yes stop_codon:yes gene_type:complete
MSKPNQKQPSKYEFVNDYNLGLSKSKTRVNIKIDDNKRMISIPTEKLLNLMAEETIMSGNVAIAGDFDSSELDGARQ